MSDLLREDEDSRSRALELDSFIVEAPAGAGKTELLTQRYLRLLATVEEPEEIIAITFTNKAAGEMRQRIQDSLALAREAVEPQAAHKRITHELARAALARSAERGWHIESQPGRLRLTTIDALCASLARQMPLLSRFGAQPTVAEEAKRYYDEAARRALDHLEGRGEDEREHAEAVATALAHMDNDVTRLARLLAEMLARREQWREIAALDHPESAIGEALDSAIILAIVILNAVMGFIQEFRAQKAMEALKKMAAPSANVLRDGLPACVKAAELVPGDLVLLEAGSVVPADLRLVECASLKTEEAPLTGESFSVEKHALPIAEDGLALGDRRNMAYSGTSVSYGRGKGLVTATGMATELGKIAGMLQEEGEVQTPLQRRLTDFGKKLAWAILGICAVVFLSGLARGEPAALMFLTSVSLAVAAIPEALPAVMSIALALGAAKMVKQNALIRKLLAVETLGSVTHICSDKTGTLTQNKMTAQEVYISGASLKAGAAVPPELAALHAALLKAGALNNDSRRGPAGWLGDPTETALCALAEAAGFEKAALDADHPRLAELPFDSERKMMTTFHSGALAGGGAQYFSVTKGAAENLLENSAGIWTPDGIAPGGKAAVHTAAEEMAARGLRVLGLAFKPWDALPGKGNPSKEKELIFLLSVS